MHDRPGYVFRLRLQHRVGDGVLNEICDQRLEGVDGFDGVESQIEQVHGIRVNFSELDVHDRERNVSANL